MFKSNKIEEAIVVENVDYEEQELKNLTKLKEDEKEITQPVVQLLEASQDVSRLSFNDTSNLSLLPIPVEKKPLVIPQNSNSRNMDLDKI